MTKIKAKTSKPEIEEDPAEIEAGFTRRSFLSKIWIGLGVVALVEFVSALTAFFNPRKTRGKVGSLSGVVIESVD